MTELEQEIQNGKKLPVMEAFYTIQGEGFHQGRAAYFIRLAGCDVGCHWCDVKESWDANEHPVLEVEEIVTEAKEHPVGIVVITGGEPLMYDLSFLTQRLKEEGFQTHIETSGAHPLTGNWDWITFSPKKFKKPIEGFGAYADELKVIVFNQSDFTFAEEHGEQMNYLAKLYLQPEWGREPEVLPLVINYVKEHPQWQVSLQTHKYMNIP